MSYANCPPYTPVLQCDRLLEKVIKQLRSRISLLMAIGLKSESGTYRTKVTVKEGRGHAEPIHLAMFCDPLGKVTMGRGEVRVR